MSRFEWWYSHSSATTGCRVNWRNAIKCHQIGIITFDTAPFDISSNISTSSGRGRMGIPPFDSSRRAGSNGGIFVLLRPLDLNGIWDLGWDLGFGMVLGIGMGLGLGLGWGLGFWEGMGGEGLGWDGILNGWQV